MNIRERWINLLHRAATGTKKSRTLLTPVGVIVFGAFTALFVLAALWADTLLNLPKLLPESARLPVSMPLMAVGVVVTAWSGFHFLRVKGTPVPFNPPPEVVATGPYRYARNPMLTGVFLFLFGLGVFVNSVSLVFFFTPLFVLVNVWELKQIEEPELVKRFGDTYIEYRQRTPMFIPGFGKPKIEGLRGSGGSRLISLRERNAARGVFS
jgi:protein-S-isoprenylcysteine O-methyltransferase Ste14